MTTMNIYDMVDTWNNGATTFTAIKMNVTDTASAAGSLLLDLQVGGSSKFRITKAGVLDFDGAGTGFLRDSGGGTLRWRINNADRGAFGVQTIQVFGSAQYIFGDNGDIVLVRDAADTLAQRRGVNAQTFRIYGTYTDASNWERLSVGYGAESLGNQFVVAHAKAGSGTNRNLWMGTLGSTSTIIGTNGTGRWTFNENGHFVANADNAYDIGANGANRPRTGYFSNVIVAANGYFAGALNNAIKLNSSGTDGVGRLTNASDTDFSRLQFGGTTSSFPALKRNSTALETKLADDSAYAPHAMQYLDINDGMTAPAAATGRARIYVDTADGDLKVVFADGTVKTIVTDT
jgi:hypothetical protein